jgi:GDP-4-dehydro-6-deoxy-D-mannose reductase
VRVLVTGGSGFAGSWLCRACAEAGDEVVGLSRRGTIPGAVNGAGGRAVGPRGLAVGASGPAVGAQGLAVDLRDAEAVRTTVRELAPEVVYHLAALSSVGRSWAEPAQTLSDNIGSAVNLLEALRLEAPRARVVWVSSCEVYGVPDTLPTPEEAPVRPANPYAVSKASGEWLAEVYAASYGLDIVRARPFSHSGPGQLPIFLLSSLARQAAEGRRGGVERLEVVTGNGATRRDFTDVRDIVRAYRLLAGQAGGAGPDLYNVSSGVSVSAADQVALIAELLYPIEVVHVVDPKRIRAHEVMDLRGAHDRLTAATGWEPHIPLRTTMADTITWWESELG